MTEPTETTEGVADATPNQTAPEQAANDDKEAAKYRRRLRDTEAERDRLSERLSVLQRAEATRLAAEHLADGSDLFLDGSTQLADLLTEGGEVDGARVAELAKGLLASHPHWRKPAPAAPPASTVTSSGKIEGSRETPTWSQVLKGGA